MFESAEKLVGAGLSVIVLGDNKAKPLGSWKRYQSEIIEPAELKRLCGWRNAKNIAIIGGRVSGQLYQMDFDDHKKMGCVFSAWKALVVAEGHRVLFDSLVIHKTPNGGYHVRWRVDTSERLASEKLAQRWWNDPQDGKRKAEAIIESKAEGGYCLCPPSPGYERIQGTLLNIPTISYLAHQELVRIAETFHSAIETTSDTTSDKTEKRRTSDTLSPGDDFNQRGNHRALLEKHRWTLAHTRGKIEYWKHPTTENLVSATYNGCPDLADRFYVFSPNTPFEEKKPYHRFGMYAVLECDGDFTLAAKQLAAEGFGEKRTPNAAPAAGRGEYTPLGDEMPEPLDMDSVETSPLLPKDPHLEIDGLVPHISWLKRYMDYIYPTIDAPDQFGLACGLSCVSMACRDMYIQFGQNRIRPNIWLAIIAPSSLYRKSSSISIAKRLIKQYDPGNEFASEQSPEAFVSQMADEDGQAFGTFFWQEMSSQLEVFEKRSYMGGYKSMLTDLYDCPEEYTRRTIKDGNKIVNRPFINIMTASTQEWLNECLSEGNLKGGFLPRFAWVTATERKRFMAFPAPSDYGVEARLIEGLHNLTKAFRGGMTVDDAAREVYIGYASELDREGLEGGEFEGLIGAFYSRLAGYTLKFSMLYQAMIQPLDSDERIITAEAMGYACRYTDYLKANIRTVLENMTFDDDNRDLLRVKNYIKLHPGITKSRLLQAVKMKSKLLNECIGTLIEANLIAQEVEKAEGKGRPKTVFYLVKRSH